MLKQQAVVVVGLDALKQQAVVVVGLDALKQQVVVVGLDTHEATSS